MEFPAPLLTAINDGAHMDLRVKLAIQLAASMGFAVVADKAIEARIDGEVASHKQFAGQFAHLALDIAGAIVQQAQARGWLESLPVSDELSEADIAHIKRSAQAQVVNQLHLQEVAERMAPAVRPVRGFMSGGGGGGFGGPQ